MLIYALYGPEGQYGSVPLPYEPVLGECAALEGRTACLTHKLALTGPNGP